jgi:hypothetical protein
MKLLHHALTATIVLAFSTAALAQSKAVQMTDRQMASIVAAGDSAATVIKLDNTNTVVFNSATAQVQRTNGGPRATTYVNSWFNGGGGGDNL